MDRKSKSAKGSASSAAAASMAALAAAAAAGDSISDPEAAAYGDVDSVPTKMAAVGNASSSSPVAARRGVAASSSSSPSLGAAAARRGAAAASVAPGGGGGGGGGGGPRCQAERCNGNLMDEKPYNRRHKVCEAHSKAPVVLVAGLRQRFCQQCSRFHELSEFDDIKRSCRLRLAGHNERRRKSSADAHAAGGNGFRQHPDQNGGRGDNHFHQIR